MTIKSIRCHAALATAFLVASVPAFAADAQRPGLWRQSMTMDLGGATMPDMPAMSPEILAQMQAMGMQIPAMNFAGNTVNTDICVTAEDIANNQNFDLGEQMKGCEMHNVQSIGNRTSGQFTCTGTMQGTGTMDFIFDSPTHYTGTTTFQGSMEGMTSNVTNQMEGTWISECPAVAP